MNRRASNWPRVCIAEVCESVIDCVNKTAPTVEDPTPYKMIRTTNVKKGWVNLDEVKYVTAEVYAKWTRRQVPRRGDVILTREAPLGEVGMIRSNDKIFLGQRLVSYRANPKKLDNRFLLYAFQEHDLTSQIKSMGAGATVEHMRVPDCEKLTLRLPPLPLQRRIGSILSAYDDFIENNTRRIVIIEEMVKRTYEEWFVHFRFPGHEGVRMVESEKGPIPEGWELKRLDQFCSFVSRGVTPKYQAGSGRFVINQKANRGAELLTSELKELEPELTVPPEKLARFGDVLVNSLGEGTIGRVHYFLTPDSEWAVDQHMTICRTHSPGNAHILYQFLNSAEGQGQIASVKTGATSMTMLNISSLRSFLVLAPEQSIVNEFWRIAKPSMLLKAVLQKKNTNLRTQRGLLLPKLISGEIDVSALPEPEALAA